jgi:hypothetical protein
LAAVSHYSFSSAMDRMSRQLKNLTKVKWKFLLRSLRDGKFAIIMKV